MEYYELHEVWNTYIGRYQYLAMCCHVEWGTVSSGCLVVSRSSQKSIFAGLLLTLFLPLYIMSVYCCAQAHLALRVVSQTRTRIV